MTKRWPRPKPKPGQLIAYYGKLPDDEPDMIFAWGDGISKRHGNLLYYLLGAKRVELAITDEERQQANGRGFYFGKTALERLEEAGYDLTTLRISIEQKKTDSPKDEKSPPAH